MNTNLISKAIDLAGLHPLAAGCNVTYQAVRKWEAAGRLPRTEWTGETQYAEVFERLTNGKVSKSELLQPLSQPN